MSRRGAALASLAASLLLGCSADVAEDRGATSPTTASTSATVTPSPKAPDARGPSCRDAQLVASRRMEAGLPVAQAFWLSSSDLDGQSAAAATKAREMVERVVERVRERCGSVPGALGSLQRRVRDTTAKPLEASGVEALEGAFAKWAETIGAAASPLQGWSAQLRVCERLGDQIRPGYALWWDYSSTGRRWWVELQVDNRTAKGRLLDLSGAISVTGLLDPRPDRFMERDKKRGGHKLFWGGSSADSMAALPFTTTSKRVGLGRVGFVYTTSEGTVNNVRPQVFSYQGQFSCSLPVPRLN